MAMAMTRAALTMLLYVLKLRRRPVAVPFSRLWDTVLRDRESSQLFSKLRRGVAHSLVSAGPGMQSRKELLE